jgi:hypothetical protein
MPLEPCTAEKCAADKYAAQEARARRAARRVGLYAQKSRSRSRSINDRGKFMLMDPCRNAIVAGERFDLEPEDVIALCNKHQDAGQVV